MTDHRTSYVAFLRGINVGGHRKVPMAALRELVGEVFSDAVPKTYIASGNLVFETTCGPAETAALLSKNIHGRFGFEVPVYVLKHSDLAALIAACPWPEAAGNRVLAFLCLQLPKPNFARMEALRSGREAFANVGNTLWLHAPEGIGRSKLAAKVEALLGVEATARNLNTLRACLALKSA